MSEILGIDLKIGESTHDLALDAIGEPAFVSGSLCLGQDLRHRLTTHPDVLGFLGRELMPGDARDLKNLLEQEAEQDPRVVPRTARAVLIEATGSTLTLGLSVLPIGADRRENLIVRVGGF